MYLSLVREQLADAAAEIAAIASAVTYGWGCIPATVTLSDVSQEASLFPKDGGYIVPVKAAVRRAEGVGEGDTVEVRLSIDV